MHPFEVYQLKKVPARYLRMMAALVPDRPYTKAEISAAFSDKFPTEPFLSPETCYQYAHYLEKMDLMWSKRREGSKEVEFYAMAAARSSSRPIYADDGSLTSLVFESLEFKIPTLNELASVLGRMKSASLANWEITGTTESIASSLFDWDFAVLLAKTLDLPFPEMTGHEERTSSVSILDFARDESVASLAPKSLDKEDGGA